MMRYQIKSDNGRTLHNDFKSECDACIGQAHPQAIAIDCPVFKDKRRVGRNKNKLGEVFGCSVELDLVRSSRVFKSRLESILFGLEEIEKVKIDLNRESQRLIHNLTKTNALNIQELYAVVPQEVLTQNLGYQLENIEKNILKDPREAAKSFLRIAKNNAAMKVEFSAHSKLMDADPQLRTRPHPVRKVTLNLFHIFFQDFKDKGVYVNFDENDDYLIFDYEIVHVALYHLIHNATKYIRPNTTLNVSFIKEKLDFHIVLQMSSVKIETDEKEKLINEGVSGVHAIKSEKSGRGIGLSLAQRLLQLNNARLIIEVNINPINQFLFKGTPYQDNVFKICFMDYLNTSLR